MEYIIHDLKTERQDVSAGLPSGYKLIPTLFYIVSVASVFLSLYFYASKKAYQTSESQMKSRTSEARTQETRFRAQQQGITAESQKAEGIAQWLEGSRPLQPVTVAINRSMSKDSTIAELTLTRDRDIPSNTFVQLKIDGGGTEQIDSARSALSSLNYQIYHSNEKKGRNSTDFQGTLVYAEQ